MSILALSRISRGAIGRTRSCLLHTSQTWQVHLVNNLLHIVFGVKDSSRRWRTRPSSTIWLMLYTFWRKAATSPFLCIAGERSICPPPPSCKFSWACPASCLLLPATDQRSRLHMLCISPFPPPPSSAAALVRAVVRSPTPDACPFRDASAPGSSLHTTSEASAILLLTSG
ncbi:hypothetical protein WOLCODRAFT_137963, partial [Wolfiporia cocos MD-104 SS10]